MARKTTITYDLKDLEIMDDHMLMGLLDRGGYGPAKVVVKRKGNVVAMKTTTITGTPDSTEVDNEGLF